jgi:hypothetical protein
MIVRCLPLILAPAAVALALAPLQAAAQTTLGPGVRTEMTPLDRAAHNGVFDHKRKTTAPDGRKPTVTAGQVAQAQENPADREPRPKVAGAPVNADADKKDLPPGSDPRLVRPAQAFPPERIEKTSPATIPPATTPPAPTRAGVVTPPAAPKDDPRSVEERKDPGD